MAKLPEVFKADAPISHTLDMRITFGKYRDKTVRDVMDENPAWLVWAHENVNYFKLLPHLYQNAKRFMREMQDDHDFDLFSDIRWFFDPRDYRD
jgi:hypothetical protein